MRKTDTRVQYTKARFADAMLDLLEQQPIGTISVKALCERAGLNRGTFYLHYSEPIDVLREMEWALFERMTVFTPEGEQDSAARFLWQIEALKKEKRLCAAVIGHNGDPAFLKAVHDRAFRMRREQLLTDYPNRSEAEIAVLFQFLFSGITGVVTAWLRGETALSDGETANLLTQISESIQNTDRTQGGER